MKKKKQSIYSFSLALVAVIMTMLFLFSSPVAGATVYSENIIPDSGGTASASSYRHSNVAGFAFDGNYNTYWEAPFYYQNNWLMYKFPTPRIVTRTKLVEANPEEYTHLPDNWDFEGSNDGVNWVRLEITNVEATETSYTNNVNNNKAYTMYRFINIDWNTDEWGGIAEVEMFETVDQTPPATTATINGTAGDNGWYISDVQVTLSATDNSGGSGLAETVYSFDNVTWIPYTEPFTITTEGLNTVYYKSKDHANNWEDVNTMSVKIDKNPPVIKISYAQGSSVLINKEVLPVKFTAVDSVSGLANGPEIFWSDPDANPIGQAVVTLCAKDVAGNYVIRVLNLSWY